MSAIITDQFRILSAENFLNSIGSTANSYYAFVGLTNSTDYKSDWETSPLDPIDSFDNYNDIWDTIVALKKINSDDVRQVIRRIEWQSGNTYDMYRHNISRDNRSKTSNRTSLYESNFYVMNSEYRVYICLNNGTDPENPTGRPSLDEPTFTDLEPRPAGVSGDGYIWKYLYTIKPNDIVKFDTLNYIPTPKNWLTNTENAPIRNHADPLVSGQIKTILITNRGSGIFDSEDPTSATKSYTNVPIVGDGSGAEATIVVGTDGTVESINVTNGGQNYTYGVVDLVSAGISGDTLPTFDVIIPPPGGHGSNIYTELGAKNVLVYSRIENDNLNPDFITGNKIARVGIIKNPISFDSTSVLSTQKASNTYAIKLTGAFESASFPSNSRITQTISGVGTAVGRVVSYDNKTGVLKYWQDRSNVGFQTGTSSLNFTPEFGYNLIRFSSSGGTVNGTINNLSVDSGFTGISTSIGGINYNLGQEFFNGISNPEVKKYSGEMIYIDNRPSITRSSNQKEDIKVILQF
jgi:hypothetical protein